MSKLFKNRKFILISIFSLLILIVSTISFIALFSNKNNDDPRFKYNSGYYNDTSTEIATKKLDSEYIKMNTLYSRSGSSVTKLNVTIGANDTIAIESESDLHAFSVLANTYDTFLTYEYVLLANIDMNSRVGETTTLWNSYDFYPIGYKGKVFSGIFNGNGHIIKNLKLKAVSNENVRQFDDTHYYAFFCQNSGTVGNFGLVDPSISINAIPAPSDTDTGTEAYSGIYYVSNVVGKNTGTVNNVFVRDNLDDDSNKTSAGIELLASNFHISGLVAVNTNVFKDSYYASTTVISSNTNPAEFQEVLIQGTNNSTESNLFFYNSLIETYSETSVKYGGFLDKTFNYTKRYGSYCSTLAALNTNVMGTSNATFTWYMGSSYTGIGDLPTFFNTVITPITRGFRADQVTYGTDNKYHVNIENTNDFSYIFELMDQNSKFASNSFVYEIDSDINMDNVLSPKYKNGIAATFKTKTPTTGYKTIVLKKFSYSTTVLGYEAYGVFPYLTGTVQYLNFVVADNTNSVTFTRNANATSGGNVVAYGAIAGYVEGGTIDSCNVYSNLKFDSGVGRYFFGGAVGILGGEGSVTNVVTSGTITETNTSHATYDDTSKNDVLPGVVLGGVIGYVESSLGSVNQLLNKAKITSAGYTGHDVALGGVVGAGFFLNSTELQNKGEIIFNGQYNALYISGVIGRLLGVSNQISMMTNNGNITVTQLAKTTYIAGVMTADIKTSGAYGTSLFKQKSAFYFYASALSNGAKITVSGAKASDGAFTNVINVLSANGFITKLSGIYNLNYRFDADQASTPLGAQEIDMSIFNNFSPVLYTNSANANNYIDLMTAYNLRDMTFTTSAAISGTDLTLTYTGCALGNNINYSDVRNEGEMKFSISNAVTANIKALGVFDELSAGFTAASIYNGGAIDIDFTATITGNVNAAGICYANRNGITNIDSYNPTSNNYDSTLIGSLNDVINNGAVKVSSASFSSITYTNYWYRHQNGIMILANIVKTTYSDSNPRIKGNINAAGIVVVNESVITNTFNLGDVKALNYITETTERQINAGGISTLNIGKYAYIINSANNGDITGANLASYNYTTTSGTATSDGLSSSHSGMISGTTKYNSDVTIGGITSRNDKKETGINYSSTASNPNSSQIISFTINYGAIYAYNYCENDSSPSSNSTTKAAGIIGAGLCNVVNINNYGKVYSGNTSAGIFGQISLSKYGEEIQNNTIYIANTLNYGNIYSLKHAYDNRYASTGITNLDSNDTSNPTYSNFSNDTLAQFGFLSQNENGTYRYYAGSIIGIIDFNSDQYAASNIVIRYLVSFYDAISISGAEMNVNQSVPAITNTIYSPFLNVDVNGYKDRDDYLATNVQYAPLSSEVFEADFLKTNASSGTDYHEVMTFPGVFNKEFTFRKVLNGDYTDGSTYFNTTTYKTDRFLTDFFQFVPYTFVNENLMDKIGWKTSAYLDAANKFANSLEGTSLLYKSDLISGTTYSTDKTAAFNTSTWSQYANPEILVQLVDLLTDGSSVSALQAYIEYIFSPSNANSALFTSELRGTIVEYIYHNYPNAINPAALTNFVNGYSTILANALCSNTDNEVKQDIIANLSSYITEIDDEEFTKETLLLAYINYLKSNTTTTFFESTSNLSKYEILQNLFSNITNESFYTTLLSLFSSENQTIINGFSDALSGYGGFRKLTDTQKITFFTNVINNANNTPANIKTYLDSFATEIGLFDYLRVDGFDEPSFAGLNTNIASTSTNNTNQDVIEERVKLWNKIKDTNTFKAWFNDSLVGTKYYLATEHNNTYQTDSAPIYRGHETITYINSENPNVLGVSSDLNFIYTQEVTPNTFFYGPYSNNKGENRYIPNGDGTTLSNTRQGDINTNTTGISATFTSNTYTNYYNAVFLTNHALTNAQKGQLSSAATGVSGNGNILSNDDPLVIFRRTETNSIDDACIYQTQYRDNLTYRTIYTDDYIIDSLGNKQSLSFVYLNRPKYTNTTFKIGDLTIPCNNTGAVKYDVYSNGVKVAENQTNWNYIRDNYVYNITVNTVNTNWHSTARTGIYVKLTRTDRQRRYDYANIFTTRYIDYKASHLLKLDGVLTNYDDGKTISNDERDIINKVFNEILLTNTNRTAFLQVVAKALFETLGHEDFTTSSNMANHIAFIDNFIGNGVTTSTKVGTTAPLAYLYHSGNQTIAAYLSTLSTDNETKKKILNAAANNKAVFIELIEILFDETRANGADPSWNPDGNGYGTSTDLKELYDKLNSSATTITGGVPYVPKNYALPIRNSSSDFIAPSNATTNTAVKNDLVKDVDNATTQAAKNTNIGYYIGDELKMYVDSSTNYNNFYFPKDSGSSTDLDNQTTTTYPAPSTDVRNYLTETQTAGNTTYRNGDYLMRIAASKQEITGYFNEGNLVYIPNGRVGDYTGGILVPRRTIWVAPREKGTMKFVVVNSENQETSFAIYRLTRSTPKNYSTYISNSEEIFYYNATLLANKAYYFEVNVSLDDVNAGYEYCICGGDSKKPYVAYVDMGASAEQDLTPSKTYYVQNTIKATTNLTKYDEFLNQIIAYLTPLDAGTTRVGSTNSTKTVANYQAKAFCDRFLRKLAKSSNEATKTLINTITDPDIYKEILEYLVRLDSRNYDSIIKYASDHILISSDYEYYLTGGYLATDYYRKFKSDLTTTTLYTKINALSNTYKYITGAQSIDVEKFQALCEHIGYPFAMNYGIFALASNEGIKNGVFIPDNLELDTMDPEYKTDTNVKFVLTDATEERVTDASWRGGTTSEEDHTDAIATYASNGVSVNEAFYIEMKQLNKSISTTVFELTLTKSNGTSDVTYFGDIDLDKHVITYYVPEITAGTYTVSSIDLAYRATAYEGTPTTASGTTFGVNSTVTINNTGASNKQFTVFAEDTNVKSVYTIIFKTLTPVLNMEYDRTKTTGTTDATHLSIASSENDKEVVLNLKDPSNLPKGFDLKPYLSLVLMNGETETNTVYDMNSEYVILSTISTDHKVTKDGNAVITMTISYRIPDGTYHIKLSICGVSTYVTFTKTASALKVLTIRYNNANVPFDANKEATSTIPFGRAYNNIELTDIAKTYSSDYDFYLDSYTVSANATVVATATKSTTPKTYYFDANTSVTYNITSYVVTYLVTAEDGTTATYKHTLTELDPYNDNADYGDLYGDGDTIQTVNTTFSTDDPTNQTKVSFERGFGKYYRIKYDFSNIYTLSDNIVYSCEETTASDLAGIATLNLEYRGISADVNDDCDAGIYSFIYKYKNTQEWNITVTGDAETGYTFTVGETSYIEYTFPRLVIEKTYSTDATLHSIVLIDQYKEQSEQSTVMDIESLRPVESSSTITYDANESYYRNFFTEGNANIKVSTPINYQLHTTDYSAVSYKDYFVVGTVSNAQLANYAPTFSTESHALIFQSITLRKMTGYGRGSQGNNSDYSVLTDHTSTSGSQLFVYLPFTYTNNGATATKIFLGKVEGKTITGIYNDQYNGTGESVATLNKTLDDLRKYKLDDTNITITDGGVTYTLSKVVGDRTNNPSLYMDYIGNPKDDHFWFVSYVVFSEDYIRSATSTDYIKFYHVALIDISNNVYFTIKVVAPKDEIFTAINQVYVTVLGNVPPANSSTTAFTQKLVGTYVTKTIVDDTENTITYELVYSITIMPSAYYYFYIDLPGGYVATTEITNPAKVFKAGVSTDYLGHIANYPGAYLPPSSLVVQRVPLTITVTRGDSSDSAWAIATSDIYTRLAVLVVNDEQSNQ